MKTKLLLLITICLMAFGVNAQVTSVALVGEAAGGWPGEPGNPGPVDLLQTSSTDGVNWTLNGVTLTTFATGGGVKFRANNDWAINWGDVAFPTGTGTQNGPNIQCIAGTYDVEFNSETGVYSFNGGTPLPTVKLVGSAVSEAGGLLMAATSPTSFRLLNVTLLDGSAQFEIDGLLFGDDTPVVTPEGNITGDIAETETISIPGGTYTSITVSTETGAFEFVAAPLIPPVSIVGDGVGGWPGSAGNPGPEDTHQLTSANGTDYKIEKLACVVGPAKFRQNNAWDINWGNVAFPTGTGTQGGDNIEITAPGTYDVTFNRSTGDYSFFFPTIAIVGDAVGGWPGSAGNPGPTDVHQMATTDGVIYTINNLNVVNGPAKFRQANDWTVNWGSTAFPTGTGTQGGDNITVTADGTYDVTLNRVTGDYAFTPSLATTTFNSANFKVSPNPTNNVWNFVSAKQAIESIQIVDVLGKIVMTINPKDMNVTVDASNLNRGMYFAKIATANATETAKLIKN